MTTLTTWIMTKSGITRDGESGDATLIATDFAGAAPIRSKFLFAVEFELRANIGLTNTGTDDLALIEYDLKTAGRPSININQEDVNYYGYRTKVATRMNYGTVQLSFYEDALNNANGLLWKYINAISPISTRTVEPSSKHSTDVNIDATQQTIGPLPGDARDGIFKSMKVYHYSPSGDRYLKTTYTYLNPKLETASYDELDMSTSDASTVTLVFTVDGITKKDEYVSINGRGEPITTIETGEDLAGFA